jgi:glutathione synthase/RimK-type ligase-like ATP-grasp enzyme/tetratricopeptide (TPR) repeat protein
VKRESEIASKALHLRFYAFRGAAVIDGNETSRDEVVKRLKSGDTPTAMNLLNELLSNDPDNADLLGLQGVALKASGDIEGAENALRRSLSPTAPVSIQFRNASNLAVLFIHAGEREKAVGVLRQGWRWPEGRVPEAADWKSLGQIAGTMHLLSLWEEQIALLAPVVDASQHDWEILRHFAIAIAASGRLAESFQLVEGYNAADIDDNERQAVFAFLYHKLNRPEQALTTLRTFAASARPYILPAQDSQKFVVGVLDALPSFERLVRPSEAHYFTTNYPAWMVKRLPHRYRFASIIVGAGAEAVREFQSFKPQVVINNVTSSEFLMTKDNFLTTDRLARSLGIPVINAPDTAAGATRQMTSERFAGIPNLVVPTTGRFVRDVARLGDLVAAIEQKFTYPVIVRTTGEHNSANMALVRGRADLESTLLSLTHRQIYVIDYVGAPRRHGFYRRIRAVFFEGVPIVIRADYSPDWIVRSRNYVPPETYRDWPGLLAHANAIISDPHKQLGAPAMAALDAIGSAMRMDVFGMDFDVEEDGRVVVFEANGSMNYFSSAPKEFPYPREAEAAFIKTLESLLDRRAGHRLH